MGFRWGGNKGEHLCNNWLRLSYLWWLLASIRDLTNNFILNKVIEINFPKAHLFSFQTFSANTWEFLEPSEDK